MKHKIVKWLIQTNINEKVNNEHYIRYTCPWFLLPEAQAVCDQGSFEALAPGRHSVTRFLFPEITTSHPLRGWQVIHIQFVGRARRGLEESPTEFLPTVVQCGSLVLSMEGLLV